MKMVSFEYDMRPDTKEVFEVLKTYLGNILNTKSCFVGREEFLAF